MKKVIILSMLLFGFTILAQSHGPEDRGPHHQKNQQAKLSPEQMAELKVKELTLLLDLSESQQKKISELELEAATKRQSAMVLHKEGDKQPEKDRFKMRSEQLDNQIAYKNAMRNILTDKQFEKWEKSHPARDKKRQQRRNHSKKHGKRH